MFALVFSCAFAAPLRAALPAAFFPATIVEPTDNAGWAALAAKFPHRLKRVASLRERSPDSPPPTRLALHDNMDYLRIRRIANDLVVLENSLETPMLVLDLRYVWADLAEASKLGALLARHTLRFETTATPTSSPSPTDAATPATTTVEPAGKRAARQITVVLVNQETGGALEAVLDALQSAGDVLLVGAQTAGDTGIFSDAPIAGDWCLIRGETHRAGGSSLLDIGVAPGLAVATDPASDEAAYLALESGTPIVALLDAPVEKARFDEAKLLRAHGDANSRTAGRVASAEDATSPASGAATTNESTPSSSNSSPSENGEASSSSSGATAAGSSSTSTPAAQKPAQPIDRTLERAVNTLLALEALRKI